MGTVNENSSDSPVGPGRCLCVFFGCMVCLYVHVCFVLPWSVGSFPFMFWRWRNKLKWAPSRFLLLPRCYGLGAGSIPFRAIVNKKQCETIGLFMSLVIHYWIGDVQDSQGVSASKMTYIVSGGALNSTHSLTHSLLRCVSLFPFCSIVPQSTSSRCLLRTPPRCSVCIQTPRSDTTRALPRRCGLISLIYSHRQASPHHITLAHWFCRYESKNIPCNSNDNNNNKTTIYKAHG